MKKTSARSQASWRVARLAVDRTTEDMKNENVVDKEPRGWLWGGKSTPKDLPEANEGTLQAVLDVLTPEYRASLHDIKIRHLEKERRVAETRRTESTRREPETLELSYAHPVDRLAAAQHAYGRIMGLAHQQKYMQNDFADYPEVAAEIIPPTFIWPNHGKRLFSGERNGSVREGSGARLGFLTFEHGGYTESGAFNGGDGGGIVLRHVRYHKPRDARGRQRRRGIGGGAFRRSRRDFREVRSMFP